MSEGLDLDPNLLAIAIERHPELHFHHADMVDFELGRTFDAVVCLFSAIGYVVTVERLHSALAAMARHSRPGGVLLVEPWLFPDGYTTGTIHALYVDQPLLKIARINVADAQVAGRSCSAWSRAWTARCSPVLSGRTGWPVPPTR